MSIYLYKQVGSDGQQSCKTRLPTTLYSFVNTKEG